MTEREAFLRAIAADENNAFVRLVYADWLDDHGDHEEAEHQRKWPEAKDWIDDICRKLNAGCPGGDEFTCDQLLDFGRSVSAVANKEIVFEVEDDDDDIPNGRRIITAIRDQIPEFWRAWSVVTGLPLNADLEQKSYVKAGWECCPNEVYPESHLAGPKPERFIRAVREEERQQQMHWEEPFDAIQDKLEEDRP